MKQGWTYKKLKELYPIVMGKTPPRAISKFWDPNKETHNLWVSIADLSKNEGKEITETKEYISNEAIGNISKVTKGSLLVSFKLTLGKMAFAGDDLYTNEAIMSLGKRDDIDLKFLYYYFSSLDWGKLATGNEKVKGKTLNKKSLGEIPVAMLSISEQERIVERLDAAFAQIDELKSNAERQLAEARALFQSALTQAMQPKPGWKCCKFNDLIENLRTGLNPRTHFKLNTSDSVGYYITVRELKGFTFEVDKRTDRINEDAIKRINERSNLKIGDVLYSGTGTIGRTALVQELPTWWNIKEGVYAITPKANILNSSFLIYVMHSEYFMSEVLSKTSGTTVRSIPMKMLKEIILSIPSISEQQVIVEHLDAFSNHVKELEEISRKTATECDALKQALLRQIFE